MSSKLGKKILLFFGAAANGFKDGHPSSWPAAAGTPCRAGATLGLRPTACLWEKLVDVGGDRLVQVILLGYSA